MKLVADSGLWSTGPLTRPTPLVAVLEVSGAVLEWTVDEPSGPTLTFTDLPRADWLWRVLGESGHTAVAAALDGRTPGTAQTVELSDVDVVPGAVEPLRRLALGHWLRRWWPASHRDGIPGLDRAILDAEIALLTAAAQDFFTDDTFDSDVAGLLAPHTAALVALASEGDPRVVELVRACTDLAADIGVALDDQSVAEAATRRRDDYALAAGADRGPSQGAIAGGVASVNWAAVPPGIFDAAEDTVEWRVEQLESVVNCIVRVQLWGAGSPTGIAVRLRSGTIVGAGALGADGSATFPLLDERQHAITEPAAWDHDWRLTAVTIGADVDESPQTRERVRAFARSRLDRPGGDAFLAEILAAESDY